MSISQKVQAVEEAFALLTQEMSDFHGWSGLTCISGCGKCCLKPDIEATVLEFLPFAHHIFLTNQSEEWLKRIDEHPGAICIFFKPNILGSGSCGEYPFRGLVCRLFGFSARVNKYGQKEFVSCRSIKTDLAQKYAETVDKIKEGNPVPIMTHYFMRLLTIDPDLARDFYPINEAIKRAIETVLSYYAYRYQDG